MTIRRLSLTILMMCVLVACQVTLPFKGIGYNHFDKQISYGGKDALVVLTYAHISNDKAKRKIFWKHVRKIKASLKISDGLIGSSFHLEPFNHKVWTMSVWESEEHMKAFVQSNAHQEAINHALPAIVSARFARITLPTKQIPMNWDKAKHYISNHGRSLF